MTEKELVSLMKEGSEEAFSALYEQYKQPVYRYCLLLTHTGETAKEITQQIFVSLWMHHKQLNPSSPLAPYLFTIAKNKIRIYFRSIARNEDLKNAWLIANEGEQSVAEYDRADDKKMELVNLALMNLSHRKQRIFRLGKLEGKSYEEISAIMGVSKNTVKNHIVEATKFIRQFVLAGTHFLSILFLYIFI